MPPDTSDVFTAIERRRGEFLDDLQQYLRIPSISTDPAYKADVARCAEFVRGRLEAAGLTARADRDRRPPAGLRRVAGRAGQADACSSTATTTCSRPIRSSCGATRRSSRRSRASELVARGATDDKGQSYAHIDGVAAMLAERGSLPVNVKFLIEGEEESGGHAIESFVRAGRRQAARLRRGGGLRHVDVRARASRRCSTRCAASPTSSSRCGAEPRPPLRHLRRRGAEPAARALAMIVASLATRRAAASWSPASTTTCATLEPWEREEIEGARVRRGGDGASELGVRGARRRAGLHHPRAHRRRGRPATSTASGAATRARAPRPCCRRGPAPRSRCAWSPTRSRSAIAELVTRHLERATPRGVTRRGRRTLHGARPILIDAKGPMIEAAHRRHGGRLGTPAGAGARGRLDPDRRHLRRRAAGAGAAARLRPPRRSACTRPTRSSTWASTCGGIRSIARLLDRVGALAIQVGRKARELLAATARPRTFAKASSSANQERELKFALAGRSLDELRQRLVAAGAQRSARRRARTTGCSTAATSCSGRAACCACAPTAPAAASPSRVRRASRRTSRCATRSRSRSRTPRRCAISWCGSAIAWCAATRRCARSGSSAPPRWRSITRRSATSSSSRATTRRTAAARCGFDPGTAERRSYLRLYEDWRRDHPERPPT